MQPGDPERCDIRVCFGPIADRDDLTPRGGLCKVGQGLLLLDIPGVARYMVTGGKAVTIEPATGALLSDVRVFFYGSVFGAILHQRRALPLHASAIVTARGAILLAGESGVGKSTLAAIFEKRGYKLLADDIAAVEVTSPPSVVMPGMPRLVLSARSIEEVGLAHPFPSLPIRTGVPRYSVPARAFAEHACHAHSLYLVRVTNSREHASAAITGTAKLNSLMEVTYRRQFLTSQADNAAYFQRLNRLGSSLKMSVFGRSAFHSLESAADWLEADFSA